MYPVTCPPLVVKFPPTLMFPATPNPPATANAPVVLLVDAVVACMKVLPLVPAILIPPV